LKEDKYSEGWFTVDYTDFKEAAKAIEGGEPAINLAGEVLGKEDTDSLLQVMKGEV
jgi:hypothetical protein